MDYGDTRNTKRLKIIIAAGILLFLGIVALTIGNLKGNNQTNQALSGGKQTTGQSADVVLNFGNQIDTQNVTVLFNNKTYPPQQVTNQEWTFGLNPGTYTLTASDTGYKQFSTSFTAVSGQQTLINVSLQPLSAPSPIADISQVSMGSGGSGSLADQISPASTITQAQYFYGNTWAVLTINTHNGIGIAYVIAQYDLTKGRWVIAYGPDDDFEESALQQLPSDVQSYVNANFYVEQGGT